MLLSWVLFRAADLGDAAGYFRSLGGLSPVTDQARLLGQVIAEPYSLLALAAAAVVTWGAPQTWDWTRRLTAPRAMVALGLLLLAWGVLATQAHNPFIYFIF